MELAEMRRGIQRWRELGQPSIVLIWARFAGKGWLWTG